MRTYNKPFSKGYYIINPSNFNEVVRVVSDISMPHTLHTFSLDQYLTLRNEKCRLNILFRNKFTLIGKESISFKDFIKIINRTAQSVLYTLL